MQRLFSGGAESAPPAGNRQQAVKQNFILVAGISQLFDAKGQQLFLSYSPVSRAIHELWHSQPVQAAGLTAGEFAAACLGNAAPPRLAAALGQRLAQDPNPPVAGEAPADEGDWMQDPRCAVLRGEIGDHLERFTQLTTQITELKDIDNARGAGHVPPPVDGTGATARLLENAAWLAEMLLDYLRTQPITQGADGPLGAELTTLLAYEREQHDLQAAHMTILASHTWMGFFAACVLQKVISQYWAIDLPFSEVKIISGLTDNPDMASTVMISLAGAILDCLRGAQDGSPVQWNNVFIMTSGYKSVIPCMTIYALLYGVEMVYTFERSEKIQSLHPRYNLQDPQARRFWEKTWKGMQSQGWTDNDVSPYLRIALQGRLENVRKTYSIS
ncbi:MAG: hypothetical protein GYA17_00805 [Chloroflexi bacterium]|nr:hypothetical protein [Chloroflexota bacterium]